MIITALFGMDDDGNRYHIGSVMREAMLPNDELQELYDEFYDDFYTGVDGEDEHGTRYNQFVAWLIGRKGFSNIPCEVTYAEFNG